MGSAPRPACRLALLALAVVMAAGCLGDPQAVPLEAGPELMANLSRLDREALVERLNRLLAGWGQDMLHATPGCLVQDYWYIKWVPDLYRMPELAQKALPWSGIVSASVRCQGDGPCDLRLQGPMEYQYLEAPLLPSLAAAQRLAALVGALGRLAGPAPPCAVPDRDATLKYELSL